MARVLYSLLLCGRTPGWDCAVRVGEIPARSKIGAMTQDEQWIQVATAPSQVEAEMLRDLLVGEGIASLVQTNDASAYLGVISMCRLLVRRT